MQAREEDTSRIAKIVRYSYCDYRIYGTRVKWCAIAYITTSVRDSCISNDGVVYGTFPFVMSGRLLRHDIVWDKK